MDIVTNPALLGAMTCVLMVAAWALGRWHASFAPEHGEPVAVPSQREEERPLLISQMRMPGSVLHQRHSRPEGAGDGAYDDALSLCDLHAEVSAFRRREQVLASLETDALLLDGLLRTSARACVAEVALSVPKSMTMPMPNGAGQSRGRA